MQVAIKIWRYDSSTGERALREYELDAPDEATLLDCLDIVKDKHDGTLAGSPPAPNCRNESRPPERAARRRSIFTHGFSVG